MATGREHRQVREAHLENRESPSREPDLDMALSVMGNKTKSVIVRYLWQNGPSRGTDILSETGISGATLSLAMQQLELWGVVSGSLPAEKRHGRSVTYTLDRTRIRELVRIWTSFVEGDEA